MSPAQNVGHKLCFKILTKDTRQIIYRSSICSALNPRHQNLRLIDQARGETTDGSDYIFIRSQHLKDDKMYDLVTGSLKRMPGFSPEELIGRTYLLPPEPDGQRFRAKIVKILKDQEDNILEHPDHIQFLVMSTDGHRKEKVAYNDIISHIEKDHDESSDGSDRLFKFRNITSHQGPLISTDRSYKGSKYNVLVEWETGESTYEPLDLIAKTDPVTCAIYAKQNGLLSTPGWKRFKSIVKNQKN